jgi:hypothetical protein
MNTATMKYDVQTAGIRISFLVMDGEMSLEMPGGSFDDQDKTEPGVCRFPQTPANLRRLADTLNAMADLHERTNPDVHERKSPDVCFDCGRECNPFSSERFRWVLVHSRAERCCMKCFPKHRGRAL